MKGIRLLFVTLVFFIVFILSYILITFLISLYPYLTMQMLFNEFGYNLFATFLNLLFAAIVCEQIFDGELRFKKN